MVPAMGRGQHPAAWCSHRLSRGGQKLQRSARHQLTRTTATPCCACFETFSGLLAQSGAQLSPTAEVVVSDAACSRSIDLQQRALEVQALCGYITSPLPFKSELLGDDDPVFFICRIACNVFSTFYVIAFFICGDTSQVMSSSDYPELARRRLTCRP